MTDLSQTQLRALEHAPGGLVTFTDDGRVVYANPAMHRLIGAAADSLTGRSMERLLTPASRVFFGTHFFPLLKLKGKVEELHLQVQTESGERVAVMISASREASDGVPLNHCAVMTMTQRHQLESALVDARKEAEEATAARDRFLAVVSHELRSPLSAISGWARIGLSDKADADGRKRAAGVIERSIQAQTRLIDDLLDVSRIVSGKMRLSLRAMDLAPLVETVIDTARLTAQAKDITLLGAVDRTPNIVFADPDRFQQIAWNLISNAMKFTPKGGQVQVSLSRVDSRLRLQVADTGAGIAASQLPYVFERFWQAEDKVGFSGGLGLGLSICKSLVELHGGIIKAESDGLNAGAVFTVELPLAAAVSGRNRTGSDRNVQPDAMASSLEGVSVLVVDDDEDTRTLMTVLLESAGAQVATAASCDSALQMLQQGVPDVLISDIGLPDKDGYELIRLIRAGEVPIALQVPAIAITGHARGQDRIMLLRAGFQAYLTKPADPAEVTALIQSLARNGKK